jgi:hypothetical protein
MIDWNDCLLTKEMQVDFERFKELKTTEEKEAFKFRVDHYLFSTFLVIDT